MVKQVSEKDQNTLRITQMLPRNEIAVPMERLSGWWHFLEKRQRKAFLILSHCDPSLSARTFDKLSKETKDKIMVCVRMVAVIADSCHAVDLYA